MGDRTREWEHKGVRLHLQTPVRNVLEGLLYQHGAPTILKALADICRENGDHLESQQVDGAADWIRTAAELEDCATSLPKIPR